MRNERSKLEGVEHEARNLRAELALAHHTLGRKAVRLALQLADHPLAHCRAARLVKRLLFQRRAPVEPPLPLSPPQPAIKFRIVPTRPQITYQKDSTPEISVIILNRNGAQLLHNFFYPFIKWNTF